MFCSTECTNEANQKFHQVECDFLCDGFGEFFTISVRAAFRTFLEALHVFGGSFDRLKDFYIKKNNSRSTIFDLDIKDSTYRQSLFLAINSLCTNEKKRTTVEKFRKAVVSAILCNFLIGHSKLNNILRTDENARFFMKFIYKHTQLAESNYHELYALSPTNLHQENEQFGVGSFPFASLLNHSCAPNVFRMTFDGFNYIIVSRPIKKGEQLFDSYG